LRENCKLGLNCRISSSRAFFLEIEIANPALPRFDPLTVAAQGRKHLRLKVRIPLMPDGYSDLKMGKYSDLKPDSWCALDRMAFD
jgi:hypothetical protein